MANLPDQPMRRNHRMLPSMARLQWAVLPLPLKHSFYRAKSTKQIQSRGPRQVRQRAATPMPRSPKGHMVFWSQERQMRGPDAARVQA